MKTTGLTGYCGYVPFSRLQEAKVAADWMKGSKGTEKAVAYYDEDSATMAVAAAMRCVPDGFEKKLDAVFFASTTAPYLEKQASATVAGAIDCRDDVRLADFGNSLRACSSALLSAFDAAALDNGMKRLETQRLSQRDRLRRRSGRLYRRKRERDREIPRLLQRRQRRSRRLARKRRRLPQKLGRKMFADPELRTPRKERVQGILREDGSYGQGLRQGRDIRPRKKIRYRDRRKARF